MSIGIRHYIFPEGEPPVRLSDRVVSGLVHGRDALPIYANTKQRALTAFLELEDGKPVRIYKTEGSIWAFDDQGDITESLQQALSLALSSVDYGINETEKKVVSLDRKLKRKRLFDEHRWEATIDQLDIIARDIWPKSKTDRLQIISGAAKRRPSMTWDAKDAIQKCTAEFYKFSWAISDLKEPGLKAFEHETRRRSNGADHPYLFAALADMALEELEIMKRRRRNKGTWYATLDIIRWKDDKSGESAMTLHKKCDSRKSAEAAARQFLVENARYFSIDATVEVAVLTDLEWKQQGGSLEDASDGG